MDQSIVSSPVDLLDSFDASTIGVMVDRVGYQIRFQRKDRLPNTVELKLPREFIVNKRYDGLSQRTIAHTEAENGELIRINFNVDGFIPDTLYIHSFFEDLVIPRIKGIGKIAIKHTLDGIIILSTD
jgi:hypothetical protein